MKNNKSLTILFLVFVVQYHPHLLEKYRFSKRNKPSGVGALRTDGLIINSLMSLNAFSASSVHVIFLDFFCKSYIVTSNHPKFGKNDERKLTIPQNALVCFKILGESKFWIPSHLSLSGV